MKQKTKTLSSLKKRIKRSAGGKLLHRGSNRSHNNGSKSKRRKRSLHVPAALEGGLAQRIRQLVPYK
ncbi:50S ribosomal protein L35 [candidate division WOR-3 bacterium]|nr:50S ribosomal protein L35 [candidate division WOR-3 bacterium]